MGAAFGVGNAWSLKSMEELMRCSLLSAFLFKPAAQGLVDPVRKHHDRLKRGFGTAEIVFTLELKGMLERLTGHHELLGHPDKLLGRFFRDFFWYFHLLSLELW